MNASPVGSDEAVRHAIQAGEEDFLRSFLQLCTAPQTDRSLVRLAEVLNQRLSQQAPRRLSPWAYLGYYRLGTDLLSNGGALQPDLTQIEAELLRPQPPGEIVSFGDAARASEELWQDMLAHFQEGGDFVSGLEAPEPQIAAHVQRIIPDARALIQQVDPDLREHMDQLQALIILSRPSQQARDQGEGFGGATCFFFRGATVLNASRRASLAGITEQLIHEYAHAELFVLGQDEPLCLNDDGERHSVLIRSDPRPMHGILHSLYVVGRVAAWTRQLLTQHPDLALREEASSLQWAQLLKQQQDFGMSSLQAIEQHARLTPLGQEIVRTSAARLMVSATGLPAA